MRSLTFDHAIVAGALIAGAVAWGLFIHATLPGVLR
jgi:hypothetical protein